MSTFSGAQKISAFIKANGQTTGGSTAGCSYTAPTNRFGQVNFMCKVAANGAGGGGTQVHAVLSDGSINMFLGQLNLSISPGQTVLITPGFTSGSAATNSVDQGVPQETFYIPSGWSLTLTAQGSADTTNTCAIWGVEYEQQ